MNSSMDVLQNILSSISKDIEDAGYSIQENVFSGDTLHRLRSEILQMYHNNSLKKSGVGRGAIVQENIRGDYIHWLSSEKLSPSQKIVWDFLESLRLYLNRSLFLGLTDFETHLTVYPLGGGYEKHLDQFSDDKKGNQTSSKKIREISFILYLNENWHAGDGGELAIYDPKNPSHILNKITPTAGKLVCFLSSVFQHEVFSTQKERVSLTGWMFR